MTKVFWTLAVLDAIAAVVLCRLFAKGPHGQFDGLLVVAYLVIVSGTVLTLGVFPLLRSDGLRAAAFVVLLLLSVPLLISSAGSAIKTIREERQFSGKAYFSGPALDLAQALVKQDAALVKQLIPAAGDLNQPRSGGTSPWQFAVLQTESTEQSIELLRALLAAGADPKRDASADTLQHAVAKGPLLTRFLLEAGANPNVLDHEQRPFWWRTLQPREDDETTELLTLMLDHGADLKLRAPDGRGPIGHCLANDCWLAAALLIERGADWQRDSPPDRSVPDLFEDEILRRDEYPAPVPERLRKAPARMRGLPAVLAYPRPQTADDVRIPDLLRDTSYENIEATRTALVRLAQQPNWLRRVVAFFGGPDTQRRNQVALLLSLKPDALPDDVQERCWSVLHAQISWYDQSVESAPREPHGWLLTEAAVIATGLASIPGPVRDIHRADFIGLRDRIETCRKANDPDAPHLPDLRKADWREP